MGKTIPYTVEYVRIDIRKHGNTYRLRTIVERERERERESKREREGEREPLLNASKKAKCAKLLFVACGSVKCRGIIFIIVIGRSMIFHSFET
jgi:hypothetical protein